MTKQYRSEALAAAHEAALGLAEAGVMSKRTMRKFDEMCLTPVEEMTPEAIRELRLRERASQAVFAPLPQRDDGTGESVGARREATAWCHAEAADAGGEERSWSGRLGSNRRKAVMAEGHLGRKYSARLSITHILGFIRVLPQLVALME